MKSTTRTRRRWIILIAAALVIAGTAGGTALGLSIQASGASVVAAADAGTLRAEFTTRLAAIGQSKFAPAPGAPLRTLRARIDNRVWSLSTYRNASGEQCIMEAVPGGGRGWGCQDRAAMFANGPLHVSWGSSQQPGSSNRSRWDVAWVEGIVEAPVASVELVLASCAVIPLRLGPDGAYFGLVGREALHGGSPPYLVRGRDESGGLVATTFVKLGPIDARSGYIGQPGAPQPARACR
jgi:hypothetical protein